MSKPYIGVYEKASQPATYSSHEGGIESVSRFVLVQDQGWLRGGGLSGVRAVRLSLPRLRFMEKEPEPPPQSPFTRKTL